MRRLFSVVTFLLAMTLVAPVATAQEATPEASPESAFAGVDLPTLDITVTTDGYEGIPESLEAGRYLVSVTVGEGASEFGGTDVRPLTRAAFALTIGLARLNAATGTPDAIYLREPYITRPKRERPRIARG